MKQVGVTIVVADIKAETHLIEQVCRNIFRTPGMIAGKN